MGSERIMGYFKVPNFIFDLPIDPSAKFILVYFCRRSDKSGLCFPSIARISKDTGIKSHTSVRKHVRELRTKGYISIPQKGKEGVSNRYQLSQKILYQVFPKSPDMEEPTPSNNDYPHPMTELSYPSGNDYPPSEFDGIPRQNMMPKEYSVKEDSIKEHSTVESEKTAFSQGSFTNNISVREKASAEHSTPSRQAVLPKEGPRPPRERKRQPLTVRNMDQPGPHNLLTRKAVDRLRQVASGEAESADLSDIYSQFGKLKERTEEM